MTLDKGVRMVGNRAAAISPTLKASEVEPSVSQRGDLTRTDDVDWFTASESGRTLTCR